MVVDHPPSLVPVDLLVDVVVLSEVSEVVVSEVSLVVLALVEVVVDNDVSVVSDVVDHPKSLV